MASKYKKLVADLKKLACQTCNGYGEYDDSNIGDMYMNIWKCRICNGSGFFRWNRIYNS